MALAKYMQEVKRQNELAITFQETMQGFMSSTINLDPNALHKVTKEDYVKID